jgi:hypothetical protein
MECNILPPYSHSGMQPHKGHFPITAIYKMSPSPLAFLKLLAMVTAEIYIVG